MESIGQRLRTWRKEKGLSLTDIYEKTGLSTGGLSAYERDEKLIGAKPLLALWSEYGLDIAWVLTGKKEGDLTPEEQELVDCYRAANDQGKRAVMTMARLQKQELESSTSGTGLTGTGEL